MQLAEHKPLHQDVDLIVTTGCQEALTYTFDMLLDPFGK
jgi:DNA-binding transcriptional MocR family regulator